MLLKNVINFYTKIVISACLFFIFYLPLSAFCSDSLLNVKKYNGLSFDKNKFHRYNKSEFYVMKGKTVFKKKREILEKEFEFNSSFHPKGLVLNDKYLVIYGLNNISVIDRSKSEILWEKKFVEKIILKPLIYLDSLFLTLDYDKIVSIDLLSSDINWQYRNDVANLQIHTNTKFIQSDSHLFYINSNRMHMINKHTGLMSDRVGVGPRHMNLNSLKHPRITCVKLYNNVLYICYDNGILLAFDTSVSVFLWQKSFLNCKNFLIYKKYILALRDNGLISLINKIDGKIIFNYSNLRGKNLKKIIFLHKMNRFLVLSEKSIFIFKFTYKNLYFDKPIFVKTDDVIQSSSNSIFLMSKNKVLKEFFFIK